MTEETPDQEPGTEDPVTPDAVPGGAPGSTGPVLGLKEASKVATVSLSTLRRRKDELVAAGATVTDDGWQIPISALVSLGLMDRVTPGESGDHSGDTVSATQPDGSPTPSDTRDISDVVAEIEKIRARLEDAERRASQAEQRAAVAEAVAVERDRLIEHQERALRMLEAGSRPPGPTGPPPPHPPRRSLFRK
ncbi:hypothetical protein [Streptomyces sp. NPDC048277]|uniref:hypothetical protein n=1 Tax=Streptomyces sp. NPDC048277 TaxID=3155027 RepID=UPI0033CDBA6F